MIELKHNTAGQIISLGHALDNTDGDTEENGLTIANTDIKLHKWGATVLANKNVGGAINISNGVYYLTLDDTDTNTLGAMVIFVHVSGALAMKIECAVITANQWDSKYGADNLQVDVVQISGDTVAADNLELQYDGTGLNGDTFPATQAQLGNIANTGAAINKVADGDTLNSGTEIGDYTDTQSLDLNYNIISPVGGAFSKDFTFNIGGTGVPVSVSFSGRLQDPAPTSDSITIQAYDYILADWVQVGILDGVNSAVDSVKTIILFANNVGTGANSGEVQIRFLASGIAADTDLYLDLLYCSFSVVSSAVGYANGSIWVNTINGTEGVVPGVNGTADNPCLLVSDAVILASLTGLTRFQISSGSIVTLTSDSSGFVGIGERWFLNLNNRLTTGATAIGAIVNGDIDPLSIGGQFVDCRLIACSVAPSQNIRCSLEDTITLPAAGTYIFDSCYSGIAGEAAPILDFNGVGVKFVNMRHYSGGLEIENMKTGDEMSFEGHGQIIINSNCTGGFIAVRGHFQITDNSGGNVSVVDNVNYKDMVLNADNAQGPGTGNNQIQLALTASSIDGAYDPSMIFIVSGTGEGQARMILQYSGSSRIAIVDRDWKVNPDSTSVYRVIADTGREHINEGLAQAGSLNSITLNTLASDTNDTYNGQVVFIRSGNGEDQAKRVIAYNGTTKIATVESDWTTLPDASSGYVMLPTATINVAELAKESTLTEMKGPSFTGATDSLEAIRARGDVAWITGAGTPAPTEEEIWNYRDRLLTEGTKDSEIDNIQAIVNNIPDNGAMTSIAQDNTVAKEAKQDDIIDGILSIQLNVTDILDYESGDWEIVNNQMIFRRAGGAILATYDLTKAGVPDSDAPDKREKV